MRTRSKTAAANASPLQSLKEERRRRKRTTRTAKARDDAEPEPEPGIATPSADASGVVQAAPDASASDVPAADAPAPDVPAVDAPESDVPAVDAPVLDAPVQDPPVLDAPVQDPTILDAPVQDPTILDAPVQDEPVLDAPAQDALVIYSPVQDALAIDAPVQEAPTLHAPVQDAPVQDTATVDASAVAVGAPALGPSAASPVRSPKKRRIDPRIFLKRSRRHPIPPRRSPLRETGPPVPDLRGEELLQHIIRHREEGIRKQAEFAAEAAKATARESDENKENSPASGPSAPQTPATPTTQQAHAPAPTPAPKSTGWGLRSLFSSLFPPTSSSPAATSSLPAAAQQQQPQALLSPEQVEMIGAGLTPTPSDRRSRSKPRPKAKKTRNERTIIKAAMRNVDPQEKDLATAWAEKTAKRMVDDTATLGAKRRQLRRPMKLKDVKEIPARRPWEATGTFGLLPEFFDDSDSDSEVEVPGWYLVDQLANEQPALKKRKVRSTDKSPASEPTPLSRYPIINTHGNSASLYDLRPRPSTIPSPMFNNPANHHDDGNLFVERRTQTQTAEAVFNPLSRFPTMEAYEKELKRTGHIEGSGTFCVPESDSDESDEEDMPWTQQPPPPPVPAHAELPAPLDATTSTLEPADPVENQRAKAMKHTPAKQSRLREVMVPSPSLLSDAGASPFVLAGSRRMDLAMPDVVALDLEDEALLDAAQEVLAAYTFKASRADAFGGACALLRYDEEDEEDEEMSEDEEW